MTWSDPPRHCPPRRGACEVDEYPINLGADPDVPADSVEIAHCAWWYRKRVVHFSFELQVHAANGTRHRLCRIDTSDGEVHRHDFEREGLERRRTSLLILPAERHDVVDGEYQRNLDLMIDQAGEGAGMAAIMTRERTTAAKAVMARLREARASRRPPEWAELNLPVVVALEFDELGDIFAQVRRYEKAVLVGVYFPESGEVEAVELDPQAEAPPRDFTPVGGGVTVGMLLATARPNRWERLLERAAPAAHAGR